MFRLILTVCLCLSAAAAQAGTLDRFTLPADPGDATSRARDYAVYIPDGLPRDGTSPLVTILHGCRQTQDDMIAQSGFPELADREGFAVLFPFLTSRSDFEPRNPNCWGFWYDAHQHQDRGEPGDLRRMIAAAETAIGTDPARRYIAGISSGAAMSVIMAVVYSEDIAAAGSVAGLNYAEDPEAVTTLGCFFPAFRDPLDQVQQEMREEQTAPAEQRLVPLMVIQSINDCTVQIGNGRNLAAAWIGYYGAAPEPVEETPCSTPSMPCLRARFADAGGRTVAETVFYEGPTVIDTHFWPGGGRGAFANPDGPPAAQLLWDFFRDKRL